MFRLVVVLLTILAVSQGQEYILEVSPPIVDTLKQESVTLNCHLKGNASSFEQQPVGIKISKIITEHQLDTLAEIEVGKQEVTVYGKAFLASGNLNESYLSITWPLATVDILATYECYVVVRAGYWITAVAAISEYNATVMQSLAFLRRDVNIRYTQLKDHVTDIEKTLANESAFEHNEFVKLIKKLDDLTQNMESKESMMISRIDKMETFLAKFGYPEPPTFVVSNATDAESWPDGDYGLPATIFGCPSNNSGTWLTGYIKHHTESTDPNHDQVSSNNGLQQPVMETSNNENYMYQRFCMIRSTSGHSWPSGSYCIAPEGDGCPRGFDFDSITWDNENTNPSRVFYEGRLPFITFPEGETQVFYCCRSDAPANTTIYLPNDRPFYLYRYKSECQEVSGMSYREDFLLFDTENSNNTDRYSSQIHPDGQAHDDVRLELCFYFPKLKEL